MKILHIIPSLHGGGAEKFTIDLCNKLSEKHEVIICSLFDITEKMFMVKGLKSNVKIVTLNKKLGIDISIFFRIYKLIKQEKVEVVNTHLRALFYSTISVLTMNIPFFHTVHNMAQNETDKLKRIIYKIFFRYFGVTPIAISKKVLVSVREEYGKHYNTQIENGIQKPEITDAFLKVKNEIECYKRDANTRVFINIGRISKQKNQKMLVEVFNRLVNEGENLILLIFGEDTSKEKIIQKQLLELASKNIHLLGMKANIADYLATADTFCLSSLYEGLPITLLEALAMGAVPICSPAGGVVDVISEEVGFVSKGFNIEDYYQSIKQFLALEEERIEVLRVNGQKLFSEKYDISIVAKNYIDIYGKK